ncbi:hypothetical protein Tco_0890485 [Tanacetum coccineum]|uniref:Reverse transcriptase domain-containing protein n=1 Tax=Tanacetum coccineum TaxID=301880 RepID=A0ABQ5C3E7_9ASTR
MTKLLEKDSDIDFNEECIKAFETFKEKLTNAKIMVSPDWSQPFELMCDASDFAVGAVLGQLEGKHFRPIHFANKTLNNAQKNYTVTEKELLVVFFAFDKFRSYLVLSKTLFSPITLHQNKKGAENVAADHLSRLENPNLKELRDEDIDDNFPNEALMNISLNDKEEIPCSWGRNTYARALVEFSAEEELKDSIVIAIPLSNGKGHTLAKIEVEYEWNPPRCNTCKVFDHVNDKCPKNPKVDAPTKAVNDGFTVVTKRKLKPNQKNKQVEGVRLSKPALNLQYRRVDKTDSSRINEKVNNEPINLKTNVPIPKKINVLNIPTQNSFGALTDDEEKGDMTTILNEDSDCEEVDAEMVFDDRNGQTFTTKGASTPVISENNLSVFAILESHVVKSKLMKMCSLVFRHWDWTSNGAWCSKGTRIILGWNHNEVDVTIINQTDQAVHSRLWLKKEKKEIFCTFVYAHNKYNQRRDLWNALCLHKVLDVQNTGLQFTWNQKPKGTDGILKKLDRVMANMTFVNDFAGSHAIFKPYRNSDHSPSVLCIPTATKVKPKPFKFFNVLIKHDRFKEVVNEAWNYHVSGFYMFRTVKKLKNLKKPLRKLMIDKGNLHANVERIRGELDTIQTQLDIDPFNIRLREIEAANVVAFNQAVLDEEMFLKQKAKISWLKDGDSNTAYFHKSVKSRVSRSRIDVISNSDGIIFANDKVPDAFVAHYEAFLGQTGYTNGFDGSNLFSNCLDEQGAAHMVRMVTDREIKDAMFSMGDEKSPGPDGFSAAFFFFKRRLDNVGVDCLFRVVTFCISVLAKIVANRITQWFEPNLVSPNQSAFIPGRSIADNILLTQELMHNYHLDRGPSRCAFKVDIQKAYDTVDWAFLNSVLMGFGFHERMRGGGLALGIFYMECVSSTSYSICINGNLHGYFQGKRGLRQGDPLSPYLFTLVMEVLTLMFKRKVMDSDCFSFHRNVLTNSRMLRDSSLYSSFIDQVMHACIVFKAEKKELFCSFIYAHNRYIQRRDLWNNLSIHKRYIRNRPWCILGDFNVSLSADESLAGSSYINTGMWDFQECVEDMEVVDVNCTGLKFTWNQKPKGNDGILKKIDRIMANLEFNSLFMGACAVFQPYRISDHSSAVLRLPMNRELAVMELAENFAASAFHSGIHLAKDRAGLTLYSHVGDIIRDGDWVWPRVLLDKYQFLNECTVPLSNNCDTLEWRLYDGTVKRFSVAQVWECIRPRADKVPWVDLIWFAMATPNSHEHLFFICPFANSVWSRMKVKAGLGRVSHNIYDIVDHFGGIARRKTTHVVIAKLVVAASAYFIWQERNWRLFKKSKRSIDQVVSCISSSVRMKLLSCAFKRTTEGVLYARLWDLPNSIFR